MWTTVNWKRLTNHSRIGRAYIATCYNLMSQGSYSDSSTIFRRNALFYSSFFLELSLFSGLQTFYH